MKIALLTLPLHANYGGILQAFALKSYLEQFGHEVWLIDNRRREQPVGNLFLWTVLRRTVESLFHHKDIFAELNDARTGTTKDRKSRSSSTVICRRAPLPSTTKQTMPRSATKDSICSSWAATRSGARAMPRR